MAAVEEAKPKPNSSLSIKLMINKKNRRVMYAEAGKEFVDLLFSFLVLPTGAIAKLALRTEPTKACSIANLYNSVENLSDSLMKAEKSVLLNPKVVSTNYSSEILNIQAPAPPPAKPAEPPKYYVCSNISSTSYKHNITSLQYGSRCPCGYAVSREVNLVDRPPESTPQPAGGQGYVKKRGNFVITDDLSVFPVDSTATIVNLWNKIQVKDPTELEERNVTVGGSEVLGLLKAAMVSNTALNDVFKAEQKYLPTAVADTESARAALLDLLLKLVKEDQKSYRKEAV